MSQVRAPQTIFPELPRDKKMVDQNGNINPSWDLFFEQLASALQTNFKPEGIVVPPLSAANIADLGEVSPAIGNIIYDNTNQAFKGILLVSLGPPIVTITKTFTLT